MTDNIVIAIIAAVPATVAALVGLSNRRNVKGTREMVQQLEIKVDGRLSELLDRTDSSARSEGQSAEREIGATRAADVEVARAKVEAQRVVDSGGGT